MVKVVLKMDIKFLFTCSVRPICSASTDCRHQETKSQLN